MDQQDVVYESYRGLKLDRKMLELLQTFLYYESSLYLNNFIISI